LAYTHVQIILRVRTAESSFDYGGIKVCVAFDGCATDGFSAFAPVWQRINERKHNIAGEELIVQISCLASLISRLRL